MAKRRSNMEVCLMSSPGDDRYDLIILGGGPAGGAAAETALALGAKVAVIERDRLGGT
jgi:pyruvate/2-oxoglutarate dehydrogenase complex dihydrolipoamide dehydrogenase (E3) component